MFINEDIYMDEFGQVVYVKDIENYYNYGFDDEDFVQDLFNMGCTIVEWKDLDEEQKTIFIESVELYGDFQCPDVLYPVIKPGAILFDHIEQFFNVKHKVKLA